MGQRAFALGAGGHDATAWELGAIPDVADAGVEGSRHHHLRKDFAINIPEKSFQQPRC